MPTPCGALAEPSDGCWIDTGGPEDDDPLDEELGAGAGADELLGAGALDAAGAELAGAQVFFGGLGQIAGGLRFTPDFNGILNRHPFPNVAHGCLLEGMALALERRFEPFSQGRGFITPERVSEMEAIAARHGIFLAPLYNSHGPVDNGRYCPMKRMSW